MTPKFATEILAIKTIRNRNPGYPAKSLARRIILRAFEDFENRMLARDAVGFPSPSRPFGRSLLSVYSVIRRHDLAVLNQGLLDGDPGSEGQNV